MPTSGAIDISQTLIPDGRSRRLIRVTPIDEAGVAGDPVEINLDSVLWMEETHQGSVLYLHQWDPNGESHALINGSMRIAETMQHLLWEESDLSRERIAF